MISTLNCERETLMETGEKCAEGAGLNVCQHDESLNHRLKHLAALAPCPPHVCVCVCVCECVSV